MRQWLLFIGMIMLVGLCSACGEKTTYDLRGTWDYTMLTQDDNIYDAGTITFSGEPDKGTYLQVNIYAVEYAGEYTVKGATLKLTGDEVWQGTLISAAEMSGAWTHEGEASGTWSATKQVP